MLLIDKPSGITAAEVVRILKRRLQPRKIGHGGTLDPLATGLLVLLLGRGTKLSSKFLEGEKTYTGVIRLGIQTDADDITGTVLSTDEALEEKFPASVRNELAAKAAQAFLGTQQQVPPRFSALKVGGRRSYDLAREGKSVALAPREITLAELRLKFLSAEKLEYFVRCSKGTYVRSLARDIARFLGTVGCVESLCRESAAGFELRSACPLDAISLDTLAMHLLPLAANGSLLEIPLSK